MHGGESEVSGINLTCWDCRALFRFDEGSFKGAVISEHWLWPYKLDKLDQNSADYEAVGKAVF